MRKNLSDLLLWFIIILISNEFICEAVKLIVNEDSDMVKTGLILFVVLLVIDFVLWRIFHDRLTVIKIKIKHLSDMDTLYEHENGDLIDLRASEDVWMKKGEFRLIPLGVAMKLPKGYKAQLMPRSSTYKNFHIIQVNSVGQIDNSYCGDNDEWKFPALAMEDTIIRKGDRICQFEIVPVMGEVEFEEVDTLESKDRGGFGSSGIA